ncbi:MAG: ribonuclease Y, partial [Candidatus Krumholzibacteriota bacterium]|nr:ribonuclease Y [Candidatus Krumholzibacteriota bacterium]
MTTNWIFPAAGVMTVVIGFLVGYVSSRRLATRRLRESKHVGESMISDAQRAAESTRKEATLEARTTLMRMKMDFEEESRGKRVQVDRAEAELTEKQGNMERRLDLLDRKEAGLDENAQALERKQKVLDEKLLNTSRMFAEQNVVLERIAGMRKEDAKRLLLKNLENDAVIEGSRRAREIREAAERDAEADARNIIVMAIQRYAADQCVETTVSVVNLPSDDMKGRIIGREGRNIRSFEMATGVDVIIDDTPEAVVISAFDPVRRETARLSMERLVEDGRIHPARIEEVVARTAKEIDEKIRTAGEQTCMDLGIHGMDPELIKLVGRMRYRTSYGQNCLNHSREVAYLAGVMAAELNLDQHIARRAGLLHDVGKVASHEVDGSHTEVGAELARKFGESAEVVNAIRAHHGDVEATSLYTPIVGAADAVSGARPGA